jgi:hypothetical protein
MKYEKQNYVVREHIVHSKGTHCVIVMEHTLHTKRPHFIYKENTFYIERKHITDFEAFYIVRAHILYTERTHLYRKSTYII